MKNESNYRILVIDDSPAIHEDFKKILLPSKSQSSQSLDEINDRLLGKISNEYKLPPFEIDSAFQGIEGINLVRKAMSDGKSYALLFLDVQMPPGKDGIETLKTIWNIDPNIQTVICTAYAKYSWHDFRKEFGDSDHLFVLKKPFDTSEVMQLATSLTKKWNLNQEMNDQISLLKKMHSHQAPEMEKSINNLQDSIAALTALNKKLTK